MSAKPKKTVHKKKHAEEREPGVHQEPVPVMLFVILRDSSASQCGASSRTHDTSCVARMVVVGSIMCSVGLFFFFEQGCK